MNAMIYRAREYFGRETFGLLILMAIMVTGFSIAAPQFLTAGSLSSIGVQAPLLGILTLAMLAPIRHAATAANFIADITLLLV